MLDDARAALAAALEYEGDLCVYDEATDTMTCPGEEAHYGFITRLFRTPQLKGWSLVHAHGVRWARWIVEVGATRGPDWACAECRPESDVLVDGFVCCYHEARAVLASNKP